MTAKRQDKIVLALAGVWMAAFAIHAGCESSPTLDGFPGAGASRSDVIIDAAFAQAPMFVAPDSVTQRTNYIDVSSQVPADGQTVQFELPTDSVAFVTDSGATGQVQVDVVVSEANPRAAPARFDVGTFQLRTEGDGAARIATPNNPIKGRSLVNLLSGGGVAVDLIVTSDQPGIVTVDKTKIRIGFGAGNSNDNTAGGGNDNSGGNTNDNTADNSNDNTAGNGNDNTAENGNDNVGDDGNANDNTAGNGNDNTDDDGHGHVDDDGNANDNMAGNGNDNTDDNGNDNVGDDGNANDNTAGNDNDNTTGNGNDNTADNGNDNTADGICSDGSIQLRREVDGPGDFEIEVRYRENGDFCREFRLDIEGFPTGWHDVFVGDVFVGQIHADSDDGKGRLRFETENGNFPSDFPFAIAGDVVSVGGHDVVLQNHCSEVFSCGNANGNDNTGGNTNDNTGGNVNDNGG